jgi:hypothetical protein
MIFEELYNRALRAYGEKDVCVKNKTGFSFGLVFVLFVCFGSNIGAENLNADFTTPANISDFAYISDEEIKDYDIFIKNHGEPNEIKEEPQQLRENDGFQHERKMIKLVYDYVDVYYSRFSGSDSWSLFKIESNQKSVFPNGIKIGMSKNEFLAFFRINESELKKWYLANKKTGLGMWIHFEENKLIKLEWNEK